jgi:hypothetical protein
MNNSKVDLPNPPALDKVGVSGWVSVSDELPKEYKHRMSRDVLTIAGSKMSVKSYDFELGRWNGSPHITITHWMELPSPPCT